MQLNPDDHIILKDSKVVTVELFKGEGRYFKVDLWKI